MYAGVVDEDRNGAGEFFGLLDEVGNGFQFGDIAHEGEGVGAQLGAGLFQFVFAPANDDDRAPAPPGIWPFQSPGQFRRR